MTDYGPAWRRIREFFLVVGPDILATLPPPLAAEKLAVAQADLGLSLPAGYCR